MLFNSTLCVESSSATHISWNLLFMSYLPSFLFWYHTGSFHLPRADAFSQVSLKVYLKRCIFWLIILGDIVQKKKVDAIIYMDGSLFLFVVVVIMTVCGTACRKTGWRNKREENRAGSLWAGWSVGITVEFYRFQDLLPPSFLRSAQRVYASTDVAHLFLDPTPISPWGQS